MPGLFGEARLVTFLDIESTSLREVADSGSIESLPVEELALHDDENEQRIFVELLNRTLRSQLEPTLAWNKLYKLYYYPAEGPGIDRTIRYRSLKKDTARGVVTARRRPDGSVSYVRHSAFQGRFWQFFDDWYLSIEPNYVFTRDGIRPDGYAGEQISKLKRRENNAALLGQFVMWRTLLTSLGQPGAQSDLLIAPDTSAPILRFEALEDIELPVSVPDEIWRSRDTYAPPSAEEELPL